MIGKSSPATSKRRSNGSYGFRGVGTRHKSLLKARCYPHKKVPKAQPEVLQRPLSRKGFLVRESPKQKQETRRGGGGGFCLGDFDDLRHEFDGPLSPKAKTCIPSGISEPTAQLLMDIYPAMT